MEWVYLAIPVTPAMEQAIEYCWKTPSLAVEALQMAILGAMLNQLGESSIDQQMHSSLEDLAGDLHRLWENGDIGMVTVREERIRV